ncbi:malto-oligosyltrehalose trehalohydrolase [Telmatospirillum sp. J64-1]|uniref:malto-oligosyltrehalose trehalohydrolase n=1 Tax=Telmatospirillum sp. J64-1 TaxID=2502183 RepID=UPI001C8F6AF7|nr:malto-oligosyltrehalose trehalohydrolase [Telmatospirillum sp. J64-1]
MKRRHHMPFGTRIEPDGVRFYLWAPDAREMELCLYGPQGNRLRKMVKLADGFWECLAEEAHAGCRYSFRVDGDLHVPDPASRWQPEDVHGPSEIIDPQAFDWQDGEWKGRPWEEAVLYELHVGTFTEEGTFAAIEKKLDYLADLGVTAVELMPVADFPGSRNWGYDGVLHFAPDSRYGRPEDLKRLVQACHARGLMAFLDVVYNHFGPDGNYLHVYAKKFFTDKHQTPWGAGINYDDEHSEVVRDFFVHNALYWLEEYHFDGLRFDAVHAIKDDSERHFLYELAERVREEFQEQREIHLVLENDDNAARFLDRDKETGHARHFTAQWNDDIHHVLHTIATGEDGGYYADYADDPLNKLGRCLAQGFAFQGEASPYRQGEKRGEPSAHLPPLSFVSFIQNHDQVGNRAMGERITALASREQVRAVAALYLMAPSIPMLFMGEEWAAREPFYFFCDFEGELSEAVREGRRKEFAGFPQFADPKAREAIPDPTSHDTFAACILDWTAATAEQHEEMRDFYREALRTRRREITWRLAGMQGGSGGYELLGGRVLQASWMLGDSSRLEVIANLGPEPARIEEEPEGTFLFATHPDAAEDLPPWSVAWYLHGGEGS